MKRALTTLTAIGLLAMLPAVAQAATITVDTTEDLGQPVPLLGGGGDCSGAAPGTCSLRTAVATANETPESDVVVLAEGETYRLERGAAGDDDVDSGDLDVLGDLTVQGDESTVDAGGLDRVFDLGAADGALRVSGLTLSGGAPPSGESGGLIRSVGSLTVLRSALLDSTVEGDGASGGAVMSEDGASLEIRRSLLSGNAATRAGGAIESGAGEVRLDRVELTGNSAGAAPGNGGALHVTGDGDVRVFDSVIRSNVAALEGGGLWNNTGKMVVRDSRIVGNTAEGALEDEGGGGLFNEGGKLIVVGSRISRNSATGELGSGGAVLNNEGTLIVRKAALRRNSSMRAGGAVEANLGVTRLKKAKLVGNETGAAPGNGGGVHLTGEGEVLIVKSRIVRNSAAAEGGGVWNSETGVTKVRKSRVKRNQSPAGANFFNDGGRLRVNGKKRG